MALSFSNPSRSYDGVRLGVWSWGYDKAREITRSQNSHLAVVSS
jgi:hypothetical protein